MRRLFWVGVGVAVAIYGTRWVRHQRERFAHDSVAAKLTDTVRDVGELVRVSVDEGLRSAALREAELRAELDQQREGPLTPG